MNAVQFSQSSDPRTSIGNAAFNAGAQKNVVADKNSGNGETLDVTEMTSPTPETRAPIQRGTTDTHYDEASSRPAIPMKQGPMQNI